MVTRGAGVGIYLSGSPDSVPITLWGRQPQPPQDSGQPKPPLRPLPDLKPQDSPTSLCEGRPGDLAWDHRHMPPHHLALEPGWEADARLAALLLQSLLDPRIQLPEQTGVRPPPREWIRKGV